MIHRVFAVLVALLAAVGVYLGTVDVEYTREYDEFDGCNNACGCAATKTGEARVGTVAMAVVTLLLLIGYRRS